MCQVAARTCTDAIAPRVVGLRVLHAASSMSPALSLNRPPSSVYAQINKGDPWQLKEKL